MLRQVDFFVIGTQKGGTTALASYLAEHPNLQMSKLKEAHHFDDESGIDWSNPDHTRLHRMFDWNVPGVLRGEATPAYMFWPPAIGRLRQYNPHARLIIGLRQPALRAYSHWSMQRGVRKAVKRELRSFANAVRDEIAQWSINQQNDDNFRRSYLRRGCYAEQIKRVLHHFDRTQIYVFRTDHLWTEPQRILTDIEQFLGIENKLGATAVTRYVVPNKSAVVEPLAPALRAELDRFYNDDIAQTSALTGLDLSDWLDSAYQEPMAG